MSATAPASARPVRTQEEERPVQPIQESPSRGRLYRFGTAILGTLPTLIVFGILATVMYFGHHTGWKMPTASSLLGNSVELNDDWCSEHLIPESQCVECDPTLYPKPEEFGFCDDHGVSECVQCNPELAQVKGEAKLPKYDTKRAIALLPRPENNSRNILHHTRIQFASAESVEKYGIDINLVRERAMSDEITANGEIVFDPTRVAHLRTRVAGTVASVHRVIGDTVQEGDVVALVDAAQVGLLKSQLLQALVQYRLQRTTVDRLRPIAGNGGVAGKTLIEAESALEDAEVALISAKQALANLGFQVPDEVETADPKKLTDQIRFAGVPNELLSQLADSQRTANLIPIHAPLDGMIVDSDIVAGEVVDSSRLIATVADPQRMWLLLNVRQDEARFVRKGLSVQFLPDDGTDEITGEVSWISPAIDAKTRTLQARVVVENADGVVRDRTFGTGCIILREEPDAIVVPRNAVQSTSDANFVFVRDKHYFEESAPKLFHVRQVRLGAKDDKYVEVLAGVLPGEVIATEGSNVLLGQLLRSNLGAGCGCHQE